MDDLKKGICCFCSLTTIILTGVLVLFSYATLDATEYGLDYSAITKTIDKTVYSSGYYFLGFGHSFVRFPSTVQSMEFSTQRTATRPPIQSRTEDGLEITFKATV